MYLLDTNVCIYFMKDAFPSLTARLLEHKPSELLISSVTVLELEYGAAKSNWGEKTRQKMAMFLAPFTILPFTTEDALVAGALRANLEKQGKGIGPYDLQIAAQAVAGKHTVVTHNVREFSRIPQLAVEDWVL